RLADAQLTLARAYGLPSWLRLVLACRVIDAIWNDDADAIREVIRQHPHLLTEMARGTPSSHRGPPMTSPANPRRDPVIAVLRDLGAADLQSALIRAVLQGRIDTARQLHAWGARPQRGAVMGPAETQNGAGMAYLLELGAELGDAEGDRLAPVALLLET